jgi:hypothetical protein
VNAFVPSSSDSHRHCLSPLRFDSVEAWAPHPRAAPHRGRDADWLTIDANGTRTCAGGWQLRYAVPDSGQDFDVRIIVEHSGVDRPEDALHAAAFWGCTPADRADRSPLCSWDYLLSKPLADGVTLFHRRLCPPRDATHVTLRYTFRWSATGRSRWSLPEFALVAEPRAAARRVGIGVVTGTLERARPRLSSVLESVNYYAELCQNAVRNADLDLLVLPECALQGRVSGSPLDLAVALDGMELARFRGIAKNSGIRIMAGLWERDADAVYNTAVLIDPKGEIEGVYRKVHLAVAGENESGVLPGSGFPVFETDIGRIGCTICVDNSTLEAARLVALGGAEIPVEPWAANFQ